MWPLPPDVAAAVHGVDVFLPRVLGDDVFPGAGNTKDGKLCIVAAIGFTLFFWFRRADADGVDKRMFDNLFQLEGEVIRATEGSRDEHVKLRVLAILDGIVYMSTFEAFRDFTSPCWYLSFCLETRKLEKLFYAKTDGYTQPYIMAWLSSLVGNNLSP
ncbi:hypothetical protein BAE44_0022869 [Dichanthelium oligosanthes]|uniref:Uncharacterized protein n=1 Tax=Dichanthelium oligosanthes TaxID=888268 RepID=A0A1E5UT70_9POAL|nr:hypothetical protein BAE44_0022869 [Dichanthelium oligosanthes]